MALTRFPHGHTRGGDQDDLADRQLYVGFLQGDTSYVTGGYAVDPTIFGMNQIDQVIPGSGSGNTMLVFAPAAPTGLQTSNVKIKVVVPNTGAEVANATNLSTNTWSVVVAGV